MNKQITVKSPANIAFIKYWGQRNRKLVLPYNDSFSMNLSNCYTEVRLEILKDTNIKELYIKDFKSENYRKSDGDPLKRVVNFYHTARKFLDTNIEFGFRIYSKNSFPKKAGIASSASFFSALTLAYVYAFDKKISKKKLSILARLSGSGSACRSIPDGFSWWTAGKNSDTSYALSIASPTFWDLVDLVVIINKEEKKVGSSEGHKKAFTSPFFKQRINLLKKRLQEIKKAFFQKDFSKFGSLIEEETISMHSVMMTQQPPLYYWSGKTIETIKKVIQLRLKGIEAYYTIDAGENIHLICQRKEMSKIHDYFIMQPEVTEIISNDPSTGAKLLV